MSRSFGLEIEIAASRIAVRDALIAATGGTVVKRRIAVGGYEEFTLSSGWIAGFDPSLKEDGLSPDHCTEVNTVPFSLSDFDAIAPVLTAVQAVHHRFTPRTGLHIHAYAAGAGAADLVAVARHTTAHVATLLPIRKERQRFLKPIPDSILRAQPTIEEEELRALWYAGFKDGVPERGHGRLHPARRRIINLGSFWFRGTVEFRWPDATLCPLRIFEALESVNQLCEETLPPCL